MRYLVAIPVYNEAKTVEAVLRQVRRYAPDILVVDDGSTDGTSEILNRIGDIHRIRHPRNLGYGQSLIDAFDFAIRHGYEWLITMDCDEQHDPVRIPDFLAAARRDDADIISGSRYLQEMQGDNHAPRDRMLINQEITKVLNEVLGLDLTDSFCGFKAYRVCCLRKLRITEPGYAMPLQFWVQSVRQGLRIREIPVPRIYKDLNRQFGGTLNDPKARLLHYYDVLIAALGETVEPASAADRRSAAGACAEPCACGEP